METSPLVEVKARLSEIVDRVAREQDRVTITRHGRPVAVIVSTDEWESIQATLEVLTDPGLADAVREGLEDAAAGRTVSLDEVRRALDLSS